MNLNELKVMAAMNATINNAMTESLESKLEILNRDSYECDGAWAEFITESFPQVVVDMIDRMRDHRIMLGCSEIHFTMNKLYFTYKVNEDDYRYSFIVYHMKNGYFNSFEPLTRLDEDDMSYRRNSINKANEGLEFFKKNIGLIYQMLADNEQKILSKRMRVVDSIDPQQKEEPKQKTKVVITIITE